MQTLDYAIRYAAQMYPHREALVDGTTRLTFAQLAERCERLGTALRSMGLRRGDRLAVLMANSHRYLELHVAVPGIGAVIVPINSRLALPEMVHILKDSGACVLIADAVHAEMAAQLTGHVEQLISAPDQYEAMLASALPSPLSGSLSEEDIAGLYYTGGTTGPGKGVILSHRNLIATTLQLAVAFEIRPEYVVLNVFPLFHLAAIAGIYALVWLGVKQVFVSSAAPGLILETIARERVTHTSIVPALLNTLIHDPRAADADLSSLMQVTHGGAPIAPSLCRSAAVRLQCRFIQGYGMTESAGLGTLLYDEQLLLDSERIASAGRAVIGMELVIRRPNGSPCAPREVGEITLRGPNVMRGYWNQPEQTAEVLRGGWLWTGDMGFEDEEHYVFVVDRAKDMIVTGGENVYSVEVESVIASRPEVLEVAVFGIPSEKWGEEVHAVLRLKPGTVMSADEVIAYCRAHVAGYKCPKSVEFAAAELPKSGVGKLLKRELRARYWSGRQRNVA